MKATELLIMIFISTTLLWVSCKPKDAAIKAAVETALRKDTAMSSATVDVKDGVVTVGGACSDDACKAGCEKIAAGVKGVKSVVNNCKTTPPTPPPSPLPATSSTGLDEATKQKITDGLKGIPGVAVEFAGDKVILKGKVSSTERMKIMQMLANEKVLSDVSALADK